MKKYIKIIILIFLIIPLNAKASSMNLNCPTQTSPGSTVACEITLTSSVPVNGISLKYNIPEEITYKNLEIKDDWESNYNEKDGLVITKSNNSQTENKIADLNIKIPKENTLNKEYTISLTDIDLSDINYNSESLPDATATIKVVSDDNTLSSLTITNGKLSPKFNKDKTNYTATVDKDSTTITATATDKEAKVTGDIGNKKLNYGANHFTITVTSPLGNTKQYKITITRPTPKPATNPNNTTTKNENNNNIPSKSNDATLKDIIIKDYEINFKKDKYNYELTISNEVTNLEITATPNDTKSIVKIIHNENLKVGENIITITITAEDGTICKYIINVTRLEQKLSSDNTIKELIIENYELDFEPEKQKYNLTIDDEKELNIKVKLNDEKATYKITGNQNLKNNSIIAITVTAEDKSQRKYTIEITKPDNQQSSIISNKTIIITIIVTLIIATTGILTTKLLKKKQENINSKNDK